MQIFEYPRLCCGTFFTLVLQARPQRTKARQHYKGDSDGLTDPEVLVGLIKVANPDYIDLGKEKLKGFAAGYKQGNCSNSINLSVNDRQVISAFDYTIKTDYEAALERMIEFVSRFIDTSENVHRDINLVRAVIDLIQQDKSINNNDIFYIDPHGKKTSKSEMLNTKRICLESLLLGVWHYVIVNRRDNSVGSSTYEKWCPPQCGRIREYTANMGESVLPDLELYRADSCSDTGIDTFQDSNPADCYSEHSETAEECDSPEQILQQTVNNPLVFNFNQYGNNGTQIGHIENYYYAKKKEN